MAALLGWLWKRLRADRPLALLACLLVAGDLVLVWLHVQRFVLRRMGLAEHWLAADQLALDDADGFVIGWVMIQMLALAAAAFAVALRRPAPALLLSAALVIGITAAKLTKPHLAIAEALVSQLQLQGFMGLNRLQSGKLVAEIGIGLAWLLLASVAVRLAGDGATRTGSALALWLVIGLAVTGGLGDLGYMLFAGRFVGAVAMFELAESGGEMAVLTLACLGFVALARVLARRRALRGSGPAPAVATPAPLPDAAS